MATPESMGFHLTSPAPKKCDPTAKNRVWGFFGDAQESHRENRPQSLQPRQGNRLRLTKTVSGRTYWPSRDPIGENGGLNLYGIVGNASITTTDYLGNSPWTDFYPEGFDDKSLDWMRKKLRELESRKDKARRDKGGSGGRGKRGSADEEWLWSGVVALKGEIEKKKAGGCVCEYICIRMGLLGGEFFCERLPDVWPSSCEDDEDCPLSFFMKLHTGTDAQVGSYAAVIQIEVQNGKVTGCKNPVTEGLDDYHPVYQDVT